MRPDPLVREARPDFIFAHTYYGRGKHKNITKSHTQSPRRISATHLGQPPHETTLLVTKHTVHIPEQVPEAQTPVCRHMQTDARIHTKTQTDIEHPPTNKHKYIDTCHHTHTHTKIRRLTGVRKLHKRSRELLLTICVPLK